MRRYLKNRALLKADRYSKMELMEQEKRCPKCGREEKIKNGFNRGKQRYLCKNCGSCYKKVVRKGRKR